MTRRPSRVLLQRQFRVYNGVHFGGVLPEIYVRWRYIADYGRFHIPSAVPPHGRIEISTMYVAPCGWRGILLHEMVHAYLWHTARDRNTDTTLSEDHGGPFVVECNRIGAKMGLPAVTDSDSWAWPWHGLDRDDLHDFHEPERLT